MWEVIKSVLAAFFGVQKERQRQHDFQHGKPGAFIAVGIVMAAVLVMLVAAVAIMAAR
ncbi:hypothetical protein L861_03045 [Litchfieldella anticariensis FP35 = DSM 16096]|uniref:DUF2970 domain-containing protein n=1 Tax=Litchfieldella anticariensis (strain DSM 16096 / CECT 5854 / CIP 108499 / LMG 22089 / FP35) TaxID=1121939 RepID=S2LI40_LITA3|nr:DUF2970 domain-containing protein [Halomonas anticariensis]EPC04311.1 hypothetical protein L861_03045 [Halomonas anticariensis FP35 = DSM 16096]